MNQTRHPDLDHLDALVGEWETDATHPALPGTRVRGTSTFEWLKGERFMIHRARNDRADFPDSVSVIGVVDGQLLMNYFDSRGVHRVYALGFDGSVLRIERDHPGFSQRFAGAVEDGGNTIAGVWELALEPEQWKDDLAITFRRRTGQ